MILWNCRAENIVVTVFFLAIHFSLSLCTVYLSKLMLTSLYCLSSVMFKIPREPVKLDFIFVVPIRHLLFQMLRLNVFVASELLYCTFHSASVVHVVGLRRLFKNYSAEARSKLKQRIIKKIWHFEVINDLSVDSVTRVLKRQTHEINLNFKAASSQNCSRSLLIRHICIIPRISLSVMYLWDWFFIESIESCFL